MGYRGYQGIGVQGVSGVIRVSRCGGCQGTGLEVDLRVAVATKAQMPPVVEI